MTPHPNHKNYDGFTCPQCGGHKWGTARYPEHVAERLGRPAHAGHCHSFECHFIWDRDDEAQESACIYNMPREEWHALYE